MLKFFETKIQKETFYAAKKAWNINVANIVISKVS